MAHKDSISFRVNDHGTHIDIIWNGAQPNGAAIETTKPETIVQLQIPIPHIKTTQSKRTTTKMNYADNKNILKTFYEQAGLVSKFDSDNVYLEKAFYDINQLWQDNLDQIETVNYLMIAEAPLWGEVKKYIYNPNANNSQFFHRSDLGDILNRYIADKSAFIKVCNEIGLLVVDISPFPLNPYNTAINYSDLKSKEYKQLVSLTIPTYFAEKIKAIIEKKSLLSD